MTPIEEIPFADISPPNPARPSGSSAIPQRRRSPFNWKPLFQFLALDLCLLHCGLIYWSLGGWSGITNGWPIWRDDHPLYLHSALVTRDFLDQSGTTAGYDANFMSGYAKSIVFPSSSTLPEVVFYFFRQGDPTTLYKLYVLVAASLAPFLIWMATGVWKLSARASFLGVLAYLIHSWGDFSMSYVGFGMIPYFLAIPLALLTTGVVARFLDRGGFAWWFFSLLLGSLTLLAHLTTAMLVIPALGATYLVRIMSRDENGEGDFPLSRHFGFWCIPLVALAANAFWWLPGIWLASTKGTSDFAFAHGEGLVVRFSNMLLRESPTQVILFGLSLPGWMVLARRSRTLFTALLGFALAGYFWGYLAGGFRSLDFLQPGRHTYALYTALALTSGLAIDDIMTRLRAANAGRLDLWLACGLLLMSIRFFVPLLDVTGAAKVMGRTYIKSDPTAGIQPPFLTSQPLAQLLWLTERIRETMKPGERLLYEEGGFGFEEKGVRVEVPFGAARFSGLLPASLGIELIGGPYLHASLKTNFTQFGEGALFGKKNWNRAFFEKYARLYGPKTIFCWSPHARAFCLGNPDLIQVVGQNGQLLFGIVKGFEGATIQGSAKVEAKEGKLVVSDMKAGVDGLVVLRYHSSPCLRVVPPCPIEEIRLEDDPVPFLGLRPTGPGPVTIEMALPNPLRMSRSR